MHLHLTSLTIPNGNEWHGTSQHDSVRKDKCTKICSTDSLFWAKVHQKYNWLKSHWYDMRM